MLRQLSTEELNRLTLSENRDEPRLPFAFVLDSIRSLNNVGSIFRTADCFRAGHLHLCGLTGTPPHREVHKTALGAELSVPWTHWDSVSACLIQLKADGFTAMAVEQVQHSIPLNSLQPRPGQKLALVLGNELHGVSSEALALCEAGIEIPQAGVKHSLNVSVAAGIVAWELARGQV